jgi:hypothetical protein
MGLGMRLPLSHSHVSPDRMRLLCSGWGCPWVTHMLARSHMSVTQSLSAVLQRNHFQDLGRMVHALYLFTTSRPSNIWPWRPTVAIQMHHRTRVSNWEGFLIGTDEILWRIQSSGGSSQQGWRGGQSVATHSTACRHGWRNLKRRRVECEIHVTRFGFKSYYI